MKDISAGYRKEPVLKNIRLDLRPGEVLTLLGPNGSGKSSLLRVASGLLPVSAGNIWFNDTNVTNFDISARSKLGVTHLMQGGRVFPSLTVKDNLDIAAMTIPQQHAQVRESLILDLFPNLASRYQTAAHLLSGGERQSLALGMALIRKSSLLLLDEPSAGLAPLLLEHVCMHIQDLAKTLNTSILLAEQNVGWALKLSNYVMFLFRGRVSFEAPAPHLLTNPLLLENLFFQRHELEPNPGVDN
ncbi:MAG TPA: ATP-binding cassette domain-containing protein [Anaerolineales bacterium]|nr:ATP-binding cassette domain-containing protein [Anaerolineales bacterium]